MQVVEIFLALLKMTTRFLYTVSEEFAGLGKEPYQLDVIRIPKYDFMTMFQPAIIRPSFSR